MYLSRTERLALFSCYQSDDISLDGSAQGLNGMLDPMEGLRGVFGNEFKNFETQGNTGVVVALMECT